jgi:hypothetical protein
MGLGPDQRAAPGSGLSTARAGNVRRVRVAGRKQRGGTDRWAATQCRAVVPLTGRSGLSAGAGQRVGCGARMRGRTWAGLRRNGGGPPR